MRTSKLELKTKIIRFFNKLKHRRDEKMFHKKLVSDVLEELKDPKYQVKTAEEKKILDVKARMERKKRFYEMLLIQEEIQRNKKIETLDKINKKG